MYLVSIRIQHDHAPTLPRLQTSPLTSTSLAACGGAPELQGTILSPNYPSNYPNLEENFWIIVAEPGQTIRADIVDFALEIDAENCTRYDYLEFR